MVQVKASNAVKGKLYRLLIQREKTCYIYDYRIEVSDKFIKFLSHQVLECGPAKQSAGCLFI